MRARGEGRIFKRGNVYWIQFYSHGAQVRESADTDDEQKAGRTLRKRLGEVAAGIARDSRALKYEDLSSSYIAEMQLAGKKSLRRNREGLPYLEAVERLNEYFAGFKAIEIDTDAIRKFQKSLQAQGLATGTINRSVACLRRMFKLAQREERLRHLPYFPMLAEAKPRKGTLPHDSYNALLKELPDYLRPVVTIGFRTGMRLGEILNLRWSNVLWLDRIIRIEDSKNGEAREIPFTGQLETVLRTQFAARQEKCDRVCFRLDHKGHARPIGNFRKPWRRACVKIGVGRMEPVLDTKGQPVVEPKRYAKSKPKHKVKYVGLIFHDLRRTFVTDAEHSGAPRHEVMKISGHKTESVYKRYAIENREQRRAALAHIDAYREKRLGDNSGTDSTEMQQEPSVSQ